MDDLDESRKVSWRKKEEELIIVEFFLVQQWKTGFQRNVLWSIGSDVQWLLIDILWVKVKSAYILLPPGWDASPLQGYPQH